MLKTLHGRVRGRTIELDDTSGLADGQEVEVQVRARPPTSGWGEGIRRTAGALADDAEWDVVMAEVHEARKLERHATALE